MVKLYSRYLDCYDDQDFFDDYGFCHCQIEDTGSFRCEFYEFCEHPETEFCYERALPDHYRPEPDNEFFYNALPVGTIHLEEDESRVRRFLRSSRSQDDSDDGIDCEKLGQDYHDDDGYCFYTTADGLGRYEWINYEEMNQKCILDMTIVTTHGRCYPDPTG